MNESTGEPWMNTKHLVELAHRQMPYGKYKGYYLTDLPEAYLVWFKQKGMPKDALGRMLEEMLEIKTNGLETLLRRIRREYPPAK
jgi:uncharacterized protein